jgi:lysophospholipid acyltransferase (LPLAT)-like uncharacterized protein
VKDGVSFVARKTGCPIVPITCSLKRKKLLGSWDSFMLPLPFNKAVVIVGKPLFVKPEDDLQAANLKIGETLDAITADADRLVQAL